MTKKLASKYCCEGHNLSQFPLSFLRSQHDSLSCCRFQRQRQQRCCAALQLSKRSKIIRHSCSCNWLDTVEIECVVKRSSNWVLHLELSSCILRRTGGRYFSTCARFCDSKNELEIAINKMWAALLTLLRNVESPKAGLLACSASTAWLDNCRQHSIEKLGSPAKASGALLGPKTCSKTVPFKLGLPSAGLSCFACSIA